MNTTKNKKKSKKIKTEHKCKKEKNKIIPQKTAILKSKYEDNFNKNKTKHDPKINYINNLIKKCQLKYNSFIQDHRDVTMSGTKRYEDKSGEYYLQNLDKFQKNSLNFNQKSITSLNVNSNNNDNSNNSNFNNYYSNENIMKSKKKKLNEELIPIPTIKQKNKLKNDFEKKKLYNAMGNAKYIRRYQYSNNISKKQIEQYRETQKNEKIIFDKVKFIQIWWKTIFQIIKIQKNLKGYLFRIKLIQTLDKREKYIDKVLNLSKSLKKIFFLQFLQLLIKQKYNNKFYFQKWNEIIQKKLILENLINNYPSLKLFKESYNNESNNNSKNNNQINHKNEEIDLEKEFNKFQYNNNENNKSSLGIYQNNIINMKKIRENNLSSSSLVLKNRKKNLNIGIELSSSQIINRTKKKVKNEYELNNQTNYNKRTRKIIINNKRTYIFDSIKKNENKRNKSNNNKKLIKNTNSINTKTNIKNKYLKEKSFNDLKSIKSNYKNKNINSNKTITFFQSCTNKSNILTKSINTYNKNIRLTINVRDNFLKSKKDVNIKQKNHHYATSNLSNYSGNILNKKVKNKKKKVYENKLDEYNKKLNLEKNIEKDTLSLDNERNKKEKTQPYIESIFDESQFSMILDNSTLNNNKNVMSYENESEKLNNENKKMRSSSCLDFHSLICQENINNNEKQEKLERYFIKWSKKTILGLLFKKFEIKNKILLGWNILKKRYITKFINKWKIYNNFIIFQKFIKYLKKLQFKLVLNMIKDIGKKILLWKHFSSYKEIINKKTMIKYLIEYQIKKIKELKDIKKRNKKYLFFSDCDLGNNNNFITDIPINNYNNNFINNNINLNNSTNNCYIINNLNYNDNNTNKINIELAYGMDFNKNNLIQNQNNTSSFGNIPSKFIEFPKEIYNQKRIKNSLAVYKLNTNLVIDDLKDNNTIDNCNIFNYNISSKNKNNNNKCFGSQENNLSKSVFIPNNSCCSQVDLITQKNQLLMAINIIEHHRKSNKRKIFLSSFKKWKKLLVAVPNTNIIKNIRKKNIIKSKNSLIEFSGGTTDYEELNKNTMGSDGFHSEFDSKSEKKIFTKSLKIFSNDMINYKLNSKNTKGIYKKKTIGNCSNKGQNSIHKNNCKIKEILFNENPNIFQQNNISFSNNKISDSYYIAQSNIEDNENNNKKNQLINKNLNLLINNFDDKEYHSIESNNFENNIYEKYFGFKKTNKIEELEISFLPTNEKQEKIKNNNGNNCINSFNNKIIQKEIVNEFDKKNKREIIIEDIEEYNEYDAENENIVKKIKSEFFNYEQNIFFRTFYHSKRNLNIGLNEKEKEKIEKKNEV